jgi:hypothetical protein
MSYFDKLSPHAKSIWRWIAGAESKPSAPPSTAKTIWPNLPSENRGAPVEQPKRNESAAAVIYPHLRSDRGARG